MISLTTNGLIPSPSEIPDRQRVEQFFNLVSIMMSTTPTSKEGRLALPSLPSLQRLVEMGSKAVSTLESNESQLLLSKLNILVTQVVARLAERNSKRLIRQIVTPLRVEAVLPVLGRIADFALPLFTSRGRSRK
jgi:hypothetical protein